jgi:hypothetical protein
MEPYIAFGGRWVAMATALRGRRRGPDDAAPYKLRLAVDFTINALLYTMTEDARRFPRP